MNFISKYFFLVIFKILIFLNIIIANNSFSNDFNLITPGVFTISHDDSFLPFGYANKNAKGEYDSSEGFEIDILKKISEEMGLTPVFKPNIWAKVLVSVKIGAADAIATIGITEERKKSYDYSDSYTQFSAIIFVPHKSKILGLKNLSGKKISVQKNFYAIPWIRSHYPEVEIVQFENAKESFKNVLEGKVFAAVYDKLVGIYTIKNDPELNGKIVSVGENFSTTPVALAFSKGKNTKLLENFNISLHKFEKTRNFSLINRKWFGNSSKD